MINKLLIGMRKKYHTLEEVRAANREAAKRWREANRVLARERVAAVYGKARYPEMVEANRRKVGETHYEGGAEYDQRADREIGMVTGRAERLGGGEDAGGGREGKFQRVVGAAGSISDSGVGAGEDIRELEEAGTVRERFEALKGRGDVALKVWGTRLSPELALRMAEDHARKKGRGVVVKLEA